MWSTENCAKEYDLKQIKCLNQNMSQTNINISELWILNDQSIQFGRKDISITNEEWREFQGS